MEAASNPEMLTLAEKHTHHFLAGRYLEAQEILGWQVRSTGSEFSEGNPVPMRGTDNKANGTDLSWKPLEGTSYPREILYPWYGETMRLRQLLCTVSKDNKTWNLHSQVFRSRSFKRIQSLHSQLPTNRGRRAETLFTLQLLAKSTENQVPVMLVLTGIVLCVQFIWFLFHPTGREMCYSLLSVSKNSFRSGTDNT